MVLIADIIHFFQGISPARAMLPVIMGGVALVKMSFFLTNLPDYSYFYVTVRWLTYEFGRDQAMPNEQMSLLYLVTLCE